MQDAIDSVAFSPDNRTRCEWWLGGYSIQLWDTDTGKQTALTLRRYILMLCGSIAFSPDGTMH